MNVPAQDDAFLMRSGSREKRRKGGEKEEEKEREEKRTTRVGYVVEEI